MAKDAPKKTVSKPKIGRPCSFTPEMGDEICERLSDGESLRSICLPETMPNRATVFRWLAYGKMEGASKELAAFCDQYAKAREEQADTIFDECLQIADDATNDYMDKLDDQGGVAYKLNGEHIQRSKLRIDTRKWMAGKLRPKKYGERLEVDNKHDISDPMKQMFEAIASRGKRVGEE